MSLKSKSTTFAFGKNWLSFAKKAVTKEKIDSGRVHFRNLCAAINFQNKSFLDIGYGQGLALFYAAELGANVSGIDPDIQNIAAVKELKKYFDTNLSVEPINDSILNERFVKSSEDPGFDVVYSWGVLHHTGNLNSAIHNSIRLTKKDGFLVLAIYNRHWSSQIWKVIKWLYVVSPPTFKEFLILFFYLPLKIATWVFVGKSHGNSMRGMDFYHD